MGYYMDIDTGGTFTDGFVRGDGRMELVKVDTTPHDLTLCFMECVEEAAGRFGFDDASDLLYQMNILRLSTTIGTNTLIQANGPKLGPLVSRGKGENVYAPAGSVNPAVDFLVPDSAFLGTDTQTADRIIRACDPGETGHFISSEWEVPRSTDVDSMHNIMKIVRDE